MKAQVPFSAIPNSVLEDSSLLPSAKVLYVLIVKHAGQKGASFVSQKYLSKDMGLCERQVKKLIKILKERSLIHVERGAGLRAVNYCIPLATIEGNSISPYTGTTYHPQMGHPVPIKSKGLKSKNEKKEGMISLAEIVQKKYQE